MLFDVFLPETAGEQKKRASTNVTRPDATLRITRHTGCKVSPKTLDITTVPDSKVTTRLFAIPSVIQPSMNDLHDDASRISELSVGDHWSGNYRANSEIQHSNSRRPSQTWRPVGQLSLSSEVTMRGWKTVRFSTTCSRECNTEATSWFNRSVQTLPTSFRLRLNALPLCGGDDTSFYYRRWVRALVSLLFSQIGLVIFVVGWVTSSAALFHQLEQPNDQQLVDDVALQRNQLVVSLTTELRQIQQVYPYEMAWRSRIDDYLAKFETLMSNAKIRGYSRQQTPFSQWTYGDALLFCLQLVTGQGYGIDVPKTHSCKLLTIPFVLIGLPFTWLLLLDVAAKWADLLNRWMHWLQSMLTRKQGSHVVAPTTFIPVNGANGLLKREDVPPASVWTVETSFDDKTSHRSRSGWNRAPQWLATVLVCVYPLVGSLFGLWSQSTLPVSFAVPFISLMFISPPASSSLLWRAAFQVYLIVGWILASSCFLLWYPSWCRVCDHWAQDLKMKRRSYTSNIV